MRPAEACRICGAEAPHLGPECTCQAASVRRMALRQGAPGAEGGAEGKRGLYRGKVLAQRSVSYSQKRRPFHLPCGFERRGSFEPALGCRGLTAIRRATRAAPLGEGRRAEDVAWIPTAGWA